MRAILLALLASARAASLSPCGSKAYFEITEDGGTNFAAVVRVPRWQEGAKVRRWLDSCEREGRGVRDRSRLRLGRPRATRRSSRRPAGAYKTPALLALVRTQSPWLNGRASDS